MSKSQKENPSEQPIELSQKERQELAADNIYLVMSVAKRFQNCGLDWDDLVGYGNIGLVYAANKFDPNRGFQFSTYAVRCIHGEICRALNSNSGTHVPINKANDARKLVEQYNLLARELNRKPTIEELALKTGMSCEKAQDLLGAYKAKNPKSLDAPVTEDGSSLGSILPSELPTPDAEAAENDAETNRDEVIRLVCRHRLPHRDGEMLSMKFGILGHDENGSTLNDIAQRFGLSRERVRQIIEQACKKLKLAPEMRQAYEEALAA